MWLLKEARGKRWVSVICIGLGATLAAAFAVLLLTNHQLSDLINWLETRSAISNINYQLEKEADIPGSRDEIVQSGPPKLPDQQIMIRPLSSDIREDLDRFNISKFVGAYEHRPIDNPWHEVELSFRTESNLYWKNKANTGWILSFNGKKLEKNNDDYYKAQV